MVEEGIRWGICHSIYWYAKANSKYMKDYDKNKKLSHIQCCYLNNSYDYMQKQIVNNFEWIKDTSQFHEDFIKNYNEKSDEGYFFEVDFQYIEKLHEPRNYLPILP